MSRILHVNIHHKPFQSFARAGHDTGSDLMLAAVYDQRGPALEVLRVVVMDDPAPEPGEVRVRVSGANPSDWRARRFGDGFQVSRQRIPHSDGAGRIDLTVTGISVALNAGLRSPLPTVRFSLSEIRHAHLAVENSTFGKVLVDLPD